MNGENKAINAFKIKRATEAQRAVPVKTSKTNYCRTQTGSMDLYQTSAVAVP